MRDLIVGTADPADDTAPDWWARIRKAITSAAMGAIAVPVAWITAKTGVAIPVEWYEPLVAGIVGGVLNWAATYFPWNRSTPTTT
jgi:hypothetical protein